MPAKLEVTLSEGRIKAKLSGPLDEPIARRLEQELLRMTQPLAPGSVEVLIDLRETTSCTLGARQVLAQIQRILSLSARRTAYLSDRPAMRGLVLWVMHLAGGGNAQAVSTPEQAERWLCGRDEGGREAWGRAAGA